MKKQGVGAWIMYGLISLLLMFLIALSGQFIYNKYLDSNVASSNIEKSIAVLAFEDQSPNGDHEWFGEGLSEEIMNILAQVEELKVAGKTSSFYFKENEATIQEIGEKLDVATVLEGSVSKIGDRVRITARLIEVESGFNLWSETYERDFSDVFDIYEEVAMYIIQELSSTINPEELTIKVPKPVNLQAYEYYLKGVYAHLQEYFGTSDVKYFKKSEFLLKAAISLDSTYANAYGALADLYDTYGNRDTIYFSKRDSIVKIGYRLDPNSPDVLIAKAWSLLKSDNPKPDSSLLLFLKAYEMSNHDLFAKQYVAEFLMQQGLYYHAIPIYQQVAESDPYWIRPYLLLGVSYVNTNQHAKARDILIKTAEINPGNRAAANMADAMDRNLEALKTQVRRFDKPKFPDMSGPYEGNVQAILALEGKYNELLDFLKSMPDQQVEYLFLQTWIYDGLRTNPEFMAIEAKAKIVYEERIAKYAPQIEKQLGVVVIL